MKTIELTPKQRREIQEQRRQASDRRIYQRLSTLLWIDDGRTREEVAALLGVTSRQVGDWLRIFRNKGLNSCVPCIIPSPNQCFLQCRTTAVAHLDRGLIVSKVGHS